MGNRCFSGRKSTLFPEYPPEFHINENGKVTSKKKEQITLIFTLVITPISVVIGIMVIMQGLFSSM
jgi:hypothetical protein